MPNNLKELTVHEEGTDQFNTTGVTEDQYDRAHVGISTDSDVDVYLSAQNLYLPKFLPMFPSDHVSRVRMLYKLIMRVHRALPGELRVLGDNYAREEFKRHKECNLQEARIFLKEWTSYAINLAKQTKPLKQAKTGEVGEYMGPEALEYMTEDQLLQLLELHRAASENSSETLQTDR